ncbi:hypothetical protein [Streptomyces sp. CA-132043]|uniref:hypothetical protein n=1 Tax=Streptomyces sp. CA-132043 TaxID=3240048 RepID=UPI003D92267E
MPIRHTRRTALLAPLLLVGACATPATLPEENGRPSLPAPTRQVYRLVLPFDAYQLSLAEYYTVSTAQDRLIRACMGRLGHEWTAVDRPAQAVELKNRRRYGVIEPAVAKRFGYHAPKELLDPYQVAQLEEEREAALSPEAKKAALDPSDGCSLKAHRQLLRGTATDYRKLDTLDTKNFKDSQTAPAVKRAVRAWSTCMHDEGYDYPSPEEAVNDPRWWENATASASRQEITTARADVRCKQRTDLVRTWFAAEKNLEESTVRQHGRYFHGLKTAKLRQLRTARAVLTDRESEG